MSVRKLGNSWWVDFRFARQRYRKRSPVNTRAGAEMHEATLRKKLSNGEPIDSEPRKTEPTFEEFADQWFDQYVVPTNKQQEQRMKRYILDSALMPFFGKMPIGRITTQDVEQYKAHALKGGVKRKTVNNRLAVLGKCIRTAYEWLHTHGMPPKIALLKCPPPPTNYLSADECELLLATASGVVREMILTALRAGIRQGEIRGLQWSSINWENRIITVRHSLNDRTHGLESPKSNRERHIPMDADLYEMLFRRKKDTGFVFLAEDTTPFDSQRAIRQLNNVREKAGLRKFTWHTLRHTFASHLAMKGVPLHVVQALLGHSTITTTMRYAHVAPSALRTAIELLNPRTLVNAGFGQQAVNPWLDSQMVESEKG